MHCRLLPDSQRCSCVNTHTHTVETALHITKSPAKAAGVAVSSPEEEYASVQILLVLSVNSEETLQQPLDAGLRSSLWPFMVGLSFLLRHDKTTKHQCMTACFGLFYQTQVVFLVWLHVKKGGLPPLLKLLKMNKSC